MLKMTPFQIILTSIFVVLALAGLYFFSVYKGFSGGPAVGPVTIWGTLPPEAMQTALQALSAKQQAFGKVSYVQQPETNFDVNLANALASGSGPDLVIINQEQLLSEESKMQVIPFSQVPERTFVNTFLPIGSIYLTKDGTYGIPLAVDPLVLYYNRSILSSAGVATVPSTWEAILGLAPTVTKKSDAGVISRATIPFGTYENVPNARGIISLLLLQAGNAITGNSNGLLRSTLLSGSDSVSGSPPADSAISFYTQFADPAKTVYTWNRSLPSGRDAFVAGDSAFYIGYASERASLAASNPNLDFDMAAIPEPQTAQNATDYGLAYAFAIPKASKNASGAYRTAAALAAGDIEKKIADDAGMAPANRSLLTPSPGDLYQPVFYPMALIARAWLSPAPGTVDTIFAAMINAIISGRENIHQAIVDADQSLTAALQ